MSRIVFLVMSLFLAACLTETEKEPMGRYDESDMLSIGLPNEKAPITGWSVAGQLAANRTDQKVTVQADFPETDVYTVQLDAQPLLADLDPIANPYAPRPEALISWSVEGNTIQRRVSVVSGMAVSGTGQGVRVEIVNPEAFAVIAGGRANYPVSAQITRGNRAADSLPPYYHEGAITGGRYFAVTNGTSGADIPIPQGVGIKSVRVIASYDGAYDATASARDALRLDQFAPNAARTASYDPRFEGFVPLVPGTEFLRLSSRVTVAARNWNCQIIWGIEG